MLEFKLDDWKVLKNIFININEIIDEVVIQYDSDGLRFNAIDRSHICFFKCNISNDFFDEYDNSEPSLLFIGLDELVNVLKRGNSKDSLLFKAENNEIKIIFENDNVRTFSITEIDMDDNTREPPNLDYSVNFKCSFDFIKNALKDADLYSDRLKFTCIDNVLILSCDGMNGDYTNKFILDEYVSVNCSASYSVSWLSKIFNSKLNSNNIRINMGDDFPMLIEMVIDNMELSYLLAPRLSEE